MARNEEVGSAHPAIMTVSFATFDRLKAKGVEAYKNGRGRPPFIPPCEGVRLPPSLTRRGSGGGRTPLCPPLERGEANPLNPPLLSGEATTPLCPPL